MLDKVTAWNNGTAAQWRRDVGLRKNVLWITCLCFGSFVSGYDTFLLSGLQNLPQWNAAFNNPSGIRVGLISSSMYLAQITSSIPAGYMVDMIGRRRTISFGSIGIMSILFHFSYSYLVFGIQIAGAVVAALAKNQTIFILGRVIIGMFGPFSLLGSLCLLNEIAHPRIRGVSGASFLVAASFGTAIVSWVIFGTLSWNSTWAWRLPVLFQAFGPLVQFLGMFWCPESPRWLLSKGRDEEALTVLATYHANGNRGDELVLREFEEISEHIQRDRNARSWKSILTVPGNRRRLALVTIVSSGIIITISPISAYMPPMLRLIGITAPREIAAVSGGLTIFNTLMTVVGTLYVDKVGRQRLYLVSTTGMLITGAVITGLAASFSETSRPSFGLAFVVMIFLYCGVYDIAWSLSVLSTSISASGFYIPVGLNALHWKFYIVFVVIQFIYLVLVWCLFVETRGRTIEQVSALFDVPVRRQTVKENI